METRFPAIQGVLNDPRKLVFVAAVWVAAGLVMGYAAVYDQADRTLALRQGPPLPVAIQHYDEARNMGPASEVTVRAEAQLDAPLRLTLRSTGETILAIPLHRLSDMGETAILAESGQATRGLGAQVARRTEPPAERPRALGVMILPLPETADTIDPRAHVETFGKGRYGSVVQINGEARDPGGFALMIEGALSVSNVELAEPFLTVRPFVEGRLAYMQTIEPVAERGRYFFWIASALALVALILSLTGFGPKDERARIYERERAQGRKWAGGPTSSAFFDPLPSQEEVTALEEASHEPSRVGQAFRLLIREIGAALGRIRRRR